MHYSRTIRNISILGVLAVLGIFVSFMDQSMVRSMAALLITSQTQLYTECIQSFSTHSEGNFSITEAQINTDDTADAIVTYTDKAHCGNAGCIKELCISQDDGSFIHVPFGFASETIEVQETISNGMRDIQLDNDVNLNMAFDGASYGLGEAY